MSQEPAPAQQRPQRSPAHARSAAGRCSARGREERSRRGADGRLLLEKQKNIPLYKRKSFWAIVGVGVLGVIGVTLAGSLLYERINRSDLGTIDYAAGK